MARPLTPEEKGWARFLISHGHTLEQPPGVTERFAWLDLLDDAIVTRPCPCGTCPSVELSGPDGVALTGRPAHVLYGGTPDLLVLLHIVGERPAYLEGVPTSNHDVCTFPPVETAQRR